MYMRIVMKGDVACGFYIYQFQLSSWCLTPVGYLEDLYVTKCERRRGLGKTILDDFINVARENGCAQVYWHAVRDNYQARGLYDKYILEDNNVRYTLKIG
jgi:GNAT superfamily N-acetyltransferase